MIDLTKLMTFLEVAQSKSFSEAASHLHLTQPAVSHQIKMLERDLGVKLFDRTGSSHKLTESGQMLLPYARKLIHESLELEQLMESSEGRLSGHLRIACSTTTGKYITPQIAGRFHQQHSDVTVSVLNCGSRYVVPYILEDDIDLGVVSYDACGEGMECQEFFNDHIILIVPAGHQWASRECLDPYELLENPIIVRESTSGTQHALRVELGKHSISLDDMDVFLEIGNSEAIVKAVEAGWGVAFVSRLAAEWALQLKRVVEVPVLDFDPRREIYLIRPQNRRANRVAEAFWSFVHDSSNIDLLNFAER